MMFTAEKAAYKKFTAEQAAKPAIKMRAFFSSRLYSLNASSSNFRAMFLSFGQRAF